MNAVLYNQQKHKAFIKYLFIYYTSNMFWYSYITTIIIKELFVCWSYFVPLLATYKRNLINARYLLVQDYEYLSVFFS